MECIVPRMGRGAARRLYGIAISAVLLLVAPWSRARDSGEPGMVYVVRADRAYAVQAARGEGHTPVADATNNLWDGVGVERIKGKAHLLVDPQQNSGEIVAEWHDAAGRWRYHQTAFLAPRHATGLRLGPSTVGTLTVRGDPVTTNVYLHGDSGAGGPSMPTVFALLATWGRAQVSLNGKPYSPRDKKGQWTGHTMVTLGARNRDRMITSANGQTYDPAQPGDGNIDYTDLEFHITFRDRPESTAAVGVASGVHALYFEDVSLAIRHREDNTSMELP